MAKAYATRHSDKFADAHHMQDLAASWFVVLEDDKQNEDVDTIGMSMNVCALKYAKARSGLGLRDENGDYDHA